MLAGLLAFMAFLAFVLALWEIQIEGKDGWAARLPAWRIEKLWVFRLTGSRPLTGYHIFMTVFLVAAVHLPLFFAPWSWRLESLLLGFYLGMVRLGASTFPWPKRGWLERLIVGTDFFVYHKQQSAGAMSDSLSTKNNKFVGTGVDVYANWRIASDVAWTVRYGIFMPGNAFAKSTDRQQFFTGLTLNF